MSPTPILDRQQPLPPRLAPPSGMTVVWVVWTAILGALLVGVVVGQPPILRRWLFHDLTAWLETLGLRRGVLVLAGATAASSLLMVAVHEGGHVLGGWLSGFRFRSIRLGPVGFDRRRGFTLHRGLLNLISGMAVVVPVTARQLGPRAAWMLAGGPVANVVSGLFVLLLPHTWGAFSWIFIAQSIGNGLSDLLPYRNQLGVSDGRFLWALFRHPARAARWLALIRLQDERQGGTLPEAWPAEFLAAATALDDDSLDTFTGHACAYSAAFHRHQDEEAARCLETCLRRSSALPVPVREALACDAAVFQARRRRRPDLAEAWLADIPPASSSEWLRSRAEAAILEARGDVPGALAKLDAHTRALASLPDRSQRQFLEKVAARWRSELAEGWVPSP